MSEATSPTPAGLVVSGLSVLLGGRKVVDDVTFTAPARAVTVLLGPNGAGKSTIVRAAAGLVAHTGDIQLGSAEGGRATAALQGKARARAIAYVPQVSALQAAMPVREVVAQGRFPHRTGGLHHRLRPVDEEAITAAMRRAEVDILADRPFNQLSHGERRRVLVARALATGAKILLLDEPTAALDVGHALALLAVLRDVADQGATVVLVLHQLQEAAAIADHAILLSAGRITHQGSVEQVIAPGPIRSVYGVEMVPLGQFACRLPGGPS
jgi:iron complex transport system ATP-binding protein